MAYTTIKKSTDYFTPKLYTGNDTDNRAVTGVPFAPNLVWIKDRSSTNSHYVQDTLRGATKNLKADGVDAEETRVSSIKSFTSDGFTLGTEAAGNANSTNFVAWNWKAETTGSGTSTGSGTGKAYSYSVNTTSGFSIVKFKGNATGGHTIPHHLGVIPKTVIVKQLSADRAWQVYHSSVGPTKYLELNQQNAQDTQTNRWNDTSPSSTVFTLGNSNTVNNNDDDYIAYCFAEVDGFVKVGSYANNGNANGPFCFTGFKPGLVIIKSSNRGSSNWSMLDIKRPGYNTTDDRIKITAAAEQTNNVNCIDILSNGFKVRGVDDDINAAGPGDDYIYIAIAAEPLVGDSPATAN